MTHERPAPAGLPRRNVVLAGLFGAVGSQLVLVPGTAAPAHAADVSLPGDGYTLSATGSTVTLTDAGGTARLALGGYRAGSVSTGSGTAALGQAPDGAPAIVVTYAPAGDGTTVTGTFVPRGRRLEVVFDIESTTLTSYSNGMMRRQVLPSSVVETARTTAYWTRDARGGAPYQAPGWAVYDESFGDLSIAVCAKGSNAAWRDSGALHLPATETTAGSGTFRATAHIAVGAPAEPQLAAALAVGAAFGAVLGSDQRFNIWTSASAPLTLRAAVLNGRGRRALAIDWEVRDFDGKVVGRRSVRPTVDAGAVVEDAISFSVPGRGIYFASFTVTSGSDRLIARTNAAVLPPHTYTEGDSSQFGSAADYLEGGAEERALLRRLGVRWSRHPQFSAEEQRAYGIRQNRLRTPASPTQFDGDPEGLRQYIDSELDAAESNNAVYYEIANEWNLKGGVLTGTGAADYVTKWVAPFAKRIAERGSPVKLMSVALAGMDSVYAQAMFDAGLAQYIHAFSLHPGRGNFTADYGPEGDGTPGSTGNYWNFHGSVRAAQKMLADNPRPDGKRIELWLTETYACTQPNVWWHEGYRQAAENVLLSQLLAKAEGVRAALWFQIYDGVKANPEGANPSNPEYHYGLMLRDRSPKPSALALAAAAEALDGASFRSRLELADDVHALLFDTPRGPLCALWSRADGYVLNADHASGTSFYPTAEPWVDLWPTKKTLTLATTRDTVTRTDCLGRTTSLAATGRKVTVTVDGAVRLFHGLDAAALTRLARRQR